MLVCILHIILVYFLAVVIYSFLAYQLAYFIFGFFPLVRGHGLSEEDIRLIRENGISHKTTAKGYEGIMRDRKIKGKAGRKAYSNHFMKAAYLFANAYFKEGEEFNDNYKYEYIIYIRKLSDEQIEKIRIRDYDKALIAKGDFVFDLQNEIEKKALDHRRMNLWERIKYHMCGVKGSRKEKDEYSKLLFLAMVFALIILFVPAIFVLRACNVF